MIKKKTAVSAAAAPAAKKKKATAAKPAAAKKKSAPAKAKKIVAARPLISSRDRYLHLRYSINNNAVEARPGSVSTTNSLPGGAVPVPIGPVRRSSVPLLNTLVSLPELDYDLQVTIVARPRTR